MLTLSPRTKLEVIANLGNNLPELLTATKDCRSYFKTGRKSKVTKEAGPVPTGSKPRLPEGSLNCGRFPLRGMKQRPQIILPKQEHQSQEPVPTQPPAMKGSRGSVHQEEVEPARVIATHLKVQCTKFLFAATHPGLQQRESSED